MSDLAAFDFGGFGDFGSSGFFDSAGFGGGGGAWDVAPGFSTGQADPGGYSPIWGNQWDMPDNRNLFQRTGDWLDKQTWFGGDTATTKDKLGAGLGVLGAAASKLGAADTTPPRLQATAAPAVRGNPQQLAQLLAQLRQRQAAARGGGVGLSGAGPTGGLLGGL